MGRERVRKETDVVRRETEREARREGGSEKETVEREMVRREAGKREEGDSEEQCAAAEEGLPWCPCRPTTVRVEARSSCLSLSYLPISRNQGLRS